MMKRSVENLNKLLSDYQVFYQKLRNYHWNVTGPDVLPASQPGSRSSTARPRKPPTR